MRLVQETRFRHLFESEVVRRSRRMVCVKVNAEKRKEIAVALCRARISDDRVRQAGWDTDRCGPGISAPGAIRAPARSVSCRRCDGLHLDREVKDHPELVDLRYDLGLLYLRNSEADRALEQFDVISKAPEGLTGGPLGICDSIEAARSWRPARPKERRQGVRIVHKEGEGLAALRRSGLLPGRSQVRAGERKDARKWYRRLARKSKQEGWLAERVQGTARGDRLRLAVVMK